MARGYQRCNVATSQTFNIDNGAGATIDEVLLSNLPADIEIISIKAVYQEATDTSGVASANFKFGTTVGGTEITAATALEVSKAVGATTPATLVVSRVAKGGFLSVRHTGIAATEGGQYKVQVVYMFKP